MRGTAGYRRRPGGFYCAHVSRGQVDSAEVPLWLWRQGWYTADMKLNDVSKLNSVTALVTVTLILSLVGCAGNKRGLAGNKGAAAHEDATTPAGALFDNMGRSQPGAARSDDVRIFRLAFQIYRLDLPLQGDSRHSLKLWNHVDEMRTDPEKTALLARNGVRIGAFSDDSWRPMRVVLEAANARVHQEQTFAQAGLPVVLNVGSVDDHESIFSYNARGRLVGKTFAEGKKLVALGYAMYADAGSHLDLEVSFEVRHDRGVMTWERVGDNLRQVPDYDSHVFKELTTVLMLNPGESLLIGPSEAAGNANLVGGNFLGGTQGGMKTETLFVVKPIPYEASSVAAG